MRLEKFTFGRKMAISVGLLTAILVLVAWLEIVTIDGLDQSFGEFSGHGTRSATLAAAIVNAQADMVTGQRGAILFSFAKDPVHYGESKEMFHRGRAVIVQSLNEIRPLLQDRKSLQVLGEIETNTAAWAANYGELERLTDGGRADEATRRLVGMVMPHSTAVLAASRSLHQIENASLDEARFAVHAEFSWAKWITGLLLALGLTASAASAVVVRNALRQIRGVAAEMSEGALQVGNAAGQVADASRSLAHGTSEQAATLEETSASAEEISAVTRKNAENTRTVTGFMSETSLLVDGANRNLVEMVHSMKEIGDPSQKISKIIRVIDEIAFQTNILALNAAVEAARAGEAGMGFAVVAGEVRNLAHRSSQAARDTAALIEESMAKSAEGSRRVDQVAHSIQQITSSATHVKTLVDEIDMGSQEQARGMAQIATAVAQMDQVTQRAAASGSQSAAAAQQLSAQAQSLQAAVERLQTAIGGAERTAMRPAPALDSAVGTKSAPPRRDYTSFPLDTGGGF
jgi:methyl-accepting chemotaxis protein